MRNSVSDQSFVMESDDEEHRLGGSEEEEEESDGSSSCGSPRVVAAGGGHPGSYASHQWPQSYRYVPSSGSRQDAGHSQPHHAEPLLLYQ